MHLIWRFFIYFFLYLIDIIEEVLLKNDVLHDNARIIANLMDFDEKVVIYLWVLDFSFHL